MPAFLEPFRMQMAFWLFVLGFLWMLLQYRGEIAGMFAAIWAKVPSLPSFGGSATALPPATDPAIDKDTQLFHAARLLFRHFEAEGCKEGMTAAETCNSHILRHDGG